MKCWKSKWLIFSSYQSMCVCLSSGLLGTVFCLALVSTLYDILCTVNKCKFLRDKLKSSSYLWFEVAVNQIMFALILGNKVQVLLAFSFYTNGMKLLSYKKSTSPEVMNCVHGIRVITTQWVVVGHTYVMYALLPTRNITAIATVSKMITDAISFCQLYFFHLTVCCTIPQHVHSLCLYLGRYVFCVEWPFCDDFDVEISGENVKKICIQIVKFNEKRSNIFRFFLKIRNGSMNVPLLYLHRYLRLTPILGITLLFSITLLRFLGNGPLWSVLMDFFIGQCERYWWSAFLYIQNYVNADEIVR